MELPFMLEAKHVAPALNVSTTTLYKHAALGDLPFPAVRIGDTWRFRKADVEAVIGAPIEVVLEGRLSDEHSDVLGDD